MRTLLAIVGGVLIVACILVFGYLASKDSPDPNAWCAKQKGVWVYNQCIDQRVILKEEVKK